MIRLNMLGTPFLQNGDGRADPGSTQRRPLALLALLSAAGDRGLSRDKLIGYLWPEREEERARHVLAQTLYALRRDVGGAEVVSGTSNLRLNPDAIRSDVADFEAAVAAGDAERAAALYGGPFLDGFYVSDAPEFERWVEAERARLDTLARQAFEREAGAATTRGDRYGAVEWWRRRAALDPLDATAAIGLMEALFAAGDRSGALRHARVYQTLVREELGEAPDETVAALIERLGSTDPPVVYSAAPATANRPDTSDPPVETVAEASASEEAPAHPTGGVGHADLSARRVARRWPLRAVVPATAALVVLAAIGTRSLLGGRAGATSDETLVFAVGAVRDYTGSDSSGIARALADMLATNLARVPDMRVVSSGRIYEVAGYGDGGGDLGAQLSRAARLAGADEVVEGALFRQGSGVLRFDVRRVDLATGAIRSAYSVAGADPFELVDRATAEFASDVTRGRTANLHIADVTTRSLIAYRLYEQGLHAFYQQDDVPAARRLFLAALVEDPAFALAEFYAAKCETLLGIATAFERFSHAVRLADRTTDREQLLIRAQTGHYWNEPSHRAAAEALARRYPDEPDGHFLLGQAIVWSGDFIAGVPHLRRVMTMDSSSLRSASTGCRACDALDALVTAYWLADSMAAAERTARQWTRLQPGSPRAWSTLAGMLLYQGRDDAALDAARMSQELRGVGDHWQLRVLIALRGGDFVTADSILARAGLAQDDGEPAWLRTLSLRYQGRLAEALKVAHRQRSHVPADAAAPGLAEAIVLFDMGRHREAAAAFDGIGAMPSGVRPELSARTARDRAWNLTHAATALAAAGDTAAVARLVDTIQDVGTLSAYGRDRRLHHYVRGLLLRARGRLPDAAEELRRGIFSLTEGYTRNSYELARTLLVLRRPAEAIAVLQPAFHGSLQGSTTYVTHTELHEAIAQAFELAAQPDSAAAHYRYVVRAWSAADPQFRARWQRARARLATSKAGQ